MNMTIRKEALRDQRAKMLAAAPDWRASDARVNPRVAIGSILAMWMLYFLITTGLGILAGAEQWEYAGRRAIVVVGGNDLDQTLEALEAGRRLDEPVGVGETGISFLEKLALFGRQHPVPPELRDADFLCHGLSYLSRRECQDRNTSASSRSVFSSF